MKAEYCKKRGCPHLGKVCTPKSYGMRDVPYCEYEPTKVWGDRRISKMRKCPKTEEQYENDRRESRGCEALIYQLRTRAISKTYRAGYIHGATEQKAIDEKRIAELEAEFDALVGLNEELCKTIDEYKKQKAEMIDKAVAWADHNVGTLTAIALRKAMEEQR